MNKPAKIQKILVIGTDSEIIAWIKKAALQTKMPWNIRIAEPLRIGAPDINLDHFDLIVLMWIPYKSASLQEVLHRQAPAQRSPEGTLFALDKFGNEDVRTKTIAIGYNLTREETILLAESNVKLLLTLPEKKSKWEAEGAGIIEKIQRFFVMRASEGNIKEETSVRSFIQHLGIWDKISDEKRMESTDSLLASLGDSARYAELMARKSLKENDAVAAEQWLIRAIHKNPNYLQAMQLLSDIYFSTKRIDDAIALLRKMLLSSPKNTSRLARLGECFIAKGEYNKAESVLTDALLIDEFNSDVRDGLGKVKCVMEDYDTAKKLLENTQHQRSLAIFLNVLGVKLVEAKLYTKAINHYKKALFVLPGNEQNHLLFFNIALAYLKCGFAKEAHRYASLAVARHPTYDKAVRLISIIEERRSA